MVGATPTAGLRLFDQRIFLTLGTTLKRHEVEERVSCWPTNHPVYGAPPPLLDWVKPAGGTMEVMSARQAPLGSFFRDGNGMEIPDAAGENKGSRANTTCKHQRTEKHMFKYSTSTQGTAKQIAHAASSKHRGSQPVFIHFHGVHHTPPHLAQSVAMMRAIGPADITAPQRPTRRHG